MNEATSKSRASKREPPKGIRHDASMCARRCDSTEMARGTTVFSNWLRAPSLLHERHNVALWHAAVERARAKALIHGLVRRMLRQWLNLRSILASAFGATLTLAIYHAVIRRPRWANDPLHPFIARERR